MSVARRDFAGAAAATTLGGDINSTATSITIASAAGWPSGTNGEFYICIDRGHAGEEKALVLSRSGTTLTLASSAKRGVDGTSAASHLAGVAVEHVGTAADLDEANKFIATPGAVGDIAAIGSAAAAGASGKWADAAHVHTQPAGYPRGVVYQTSLTSTQTFTGTSADVTGLTAITLTGDGVRRYRISAYVPVKLNTSGQPCVGYLAEGATLLTTLGQTPNAPTTPTFGYVVSGWYELVPTAGSHTYKVVLLFGLGGGATNPTSANSGGPIQAVAEDIGT